MLVGQIQEGLDSTVFRYRRLGVLAAGRLVGSTRREDSANAKRLVDVVEAQGLQLGAGEVEATAVTTVTGVPGCKSGVDVAEAGREPHGDLQGCAWEGEGMPSRDRNIEDFEE
jgi:hypothetical protein